MKKYKHKTQKDWTAKKSTKFIACYEVIMREGSYIIPSEIFENSNDWELINTIEVGKVYKDTDTNFLILIKELLNKNQSNAIGFDKSGKWHELSSFGTHDLIETTKEEWFKRLKEEAVKQGLVKGVKFKSAYKDIEFVINFFSLNGYDLFGNKGCLMDSDTGKWATVIEDKKPNYLITAFNCIEQIVKIGSNGKYDNLFTLNEMLNSPPSVKDGSFEVYSVKNDKGEEFTIGEKVLTCKDNFTIKAFKINMDGIIVYFNESDEYDGLELISKIKIEDKKPILTTHDGVDLFEGDKYFPVHTRYFTNGAESTIKRCYKECNYTHEDYIVFSTKEKAQEYIDWNQKKYSLNDIKDSFKRLSWQNSSFNHVKKELNK